MKSPLIKKQSFQTMFEQLVLKTQQLKKKNDHYQRLSSENIDGSMMRTIKEEKDINDQEILQTKNFIKEMEHKFRDPQQVNKIKTGRKDYEKQNNRYNTIMETLMNQTVVERSGIVDRNSERIKGNPEDNKSQFSEGRKSKQFQKQEIQQQQSQVSEDVEFERRLLMQKKQAIDYVEKQTYKIHDVVNDMGKEINEQGQNLDKIGEQLTKAKDNIEETNQHLEKAETYQKSSKKKYIVLVLLILLIVGGGIGLFMILR